MKIKEKSLLSALIRETRSRNYRTAKEFWSQNRSKLGVSYPHYAQVETGNKFPDIELAISISNILSIDIRLICHTWAKDQMPDALTRSFFEPLPGVEQRSGQPQFQVPSLDDYFIFTEKHISDLITHPEIWDVFSFCISTTGLGFPTVGAIAKSLGLTLDKTAHSVDWLCGEGILKLDPSSGRVTTLRRFSHVPNTPAFSKIRNQNFKRTSADLLEKITPEDLSHKEAFRATFQRRLTRKQAEQVCESLDQSISHVGSMNDLGDEFFALTICFGSRGKIFLDD